ncbi:MAG: glycine oxidase ThiO [Dehalococcoidia bacterium]|nr:glycine oxidase ThiO [Dehalococcoidia bacterium]
MRVAIAGGGIIGCAIAYFLQSAGASVTLIERGEIGGEASGAAAGLLIPPAAAVAPGPFRDLCLASLDLYPGVIAAVQAESGIDAECLASGILVLAESPELVQPLRAHARRQDASGRPTDWVDGAALRLLEPALSRRVLGAAYSPDEKHVNPGLLTQAFARAAQRRGAELRVGGALTGFLGRGPQVRGVSTANGDVPADAVVLAAGPWTGALGARLGAGFRTPPMRGQMIAYRSAAIRHAVWGEDGYLVPKARGFLFAGATVEDVGFRKTATARGIAGLRRMAAGLVPALRHAEVASTWAGLRPGSPDGWPVIGRLPGRDNVYVATGHFRNGILLAPITGKLVSELVLEGRSDPLLAAFGPERFG